MGIFNDFILIIVNKKINEIESLCDDMDFEIDSNILENSRKQLANKPKIQKIYQKQFFVMVLGGLVK